MALIVPIYVNETVIGSITCVRIAGGMNKDDVNEYKVEVVENAEKLYFAKHYNFNLDHRYGDGALILIRKVLEKVEEIKKSRV